MANEEQFNFEVENQAYEATVEKISDEDIATGVYKFVKDQRGSVKMSDVRDVAVICAAIAIGVVLVKPNVDSYFAERKQKAEIAKLETPETIVIDGVVYKAETPEIEEEIVVDGRTYVIKQPEQDSPQAETQNQSIGSRAEIEAERLSKFSEVVVSLEHKEGVKGENLIIFEDRGLLTITKPKEIENHGEEAIIRFFVNTEQAEKQLNDPNSNDYHEEHRNLNFWITSTTTPDKAIRDKNGNIRLENGGEIKEDYTITYYNEDGTKRREISGMLVTVDATDGSGENWILFLDKNTGEARPASFVSAAINGEGKDRTVDDFGIDYIEIRMKEDALSHEKKASVIFAVAAEHVLDVTEEKEGRQLPYDQGWSRKELK